MTDSKKQKVLAIVTVVSIALAYGILLAGVLFGTFKAGYEAGQKEANVITLAEPKRANVPDNRPKPILHTLANQSDLYESVIWKVGDYIVGEDGWELTGSIRYHGANQISPNYHLIYDGLSGVPTNDSDQYNLTGVSYLNLSCYAYGDIYLSIDDGNGYDSVYCNESNYYNVAVSVRKEGVEQGYCYTGECFGLVSGNNYTFTQVLTTVPPWNIYGSTQKWYGWGGYSDYNHAYTGDHFTVNVTLDGIILHSKAPYAQPIEITNKLMVRAGVEISNDPDGSVEDENLMAGINIYPGETAYFKEDFYIKIESVANFVLVNDFGEIASTIDYNWNTYTTKMNFQSTSDNTYELVYPEVGNVGGVFNNVFGTMALAFSSLAPILNMQIMGTFTLGFLLIIPLVIALITLIIRAVKK